MSNGHYQLKVKNGKTVKSGTLRIDKVFFGLRIARNTGTRHKNVYQAINVALSYLKKENERDAFVALQRGTVNFLQILDWYENRTTKDKPWKVGGKVLTSEMEKWISTTRDIKDRTKRSYKYHIRKVGTFTPKYGDTVSALPDIVEAYKIKCKDKIVEFNRFRSTCMSYSAQLPNGKDGEVWKRISKIKPYKKKDRKASTRYNPFTPLEIDNLFIKGQHKVFKQLLYWMCLTGIRPEEYTEHGFTTHDKVIEIFGDKTAGSYARVVPKFFKNYDPQASKLKISYTVLRLLFKKHCPNHTPRDTRRTFSIWCQKAGIESNHIKAYMGHIPSQLDNYQRQDITKNWASIDRKKLEDYITRERKGIPEIDSSKESLPTSIDDLGDSASTYTLAQVRNIINDWLKESHPKHIRRLYQVEKLVHVDLLGNG